MSTAPFDEYNRRNRGRNADFNHQYGHRREGPHLPSSATSSITQRTEDNSMTMPNGSSYDIGRFLVRHRDQLIYERNKAQGAGRPLRGVPEASVPNVRCDLAIRAGYADQRITGSVTALVSSGRRRSYQRPQTSFPEMAASQSRSIEKFAKAKCHRRRTRLCHFSGRRLGPNWKNRRKPHC